MNFKPILIVPGERKSIFFEIFFKSLKSKSFFSPLILICDKQNLNKEIKRYKFNKNIELVAFEDALEDLIDNSQIDNSKNSKNFVNDA